MVRDTSLEAYQKLIDSGRKDTVDAKVLEKLIALNCQVTRMELSQITGVPIQTMCGVVNRLIKLKAIEDAPRRECRVTGNSSHVIQLITDPIKEDFEEDGQGVLFPC